MQLLRTTALAEQAEQAETMLPEQRYSPIW